MSIDADAYVAGKGTVSKIERSGDALLITTQGDVSIVNRQFVVGQPKETGLLPDDIDRLEQSAIGVVAQAQNALDAANDRLANVRIVKADAKPISDAIRADYAARVAATQASAGVGLEVPA